MIRNIDPRLYRAAKARAAEQGRTVGDVINEAMRDLLARPTRRAKRRGPSLADLPVFDFGPASEHWSENKAEFLYGD